MNTAALLRTTTATLCYVIVLAAGELAAGEDADTLVEWHKELVAPGGILDPELSTTAANKIVQRGITSDDPHTVGRTVWGMGMHSMEVALHEPVVSRSFWLIPGLKEFLIDYWNESLRNNPGSWTDPAAIGGMVPLILAAQYPADEDVYNIVWDFYAQGQNVFGTLLCLNVGRFNTPEANKLRMDALSSEDFTTYAVGALGLAMAKPKDGLDALISALRDNPVSATMPATEEALAAYGPEAVAKLRAAVESGDLPESTEFAVEATLDKLAEAPASIR